MSKSVRFAVSETGTAQVQRKFNSIDLSIGSIAKKAVGFGALFFGSTALINFIKDASEKFSIQENAVNQLSSAYGKNTKELEKYASELQSITVYGDEAILQAQSMIASFVKSEDSIKKITKATLDYATANKTDLNTSAQLLTRTFATNTNALKRYGIEVKGSANSSERLSSLLDSINSKFGGRAQAEALTYSGKIKQLQNTFGDLQEVLIQDSGIIHLMDMLIKKSNTINPIFTGLTYVLKSVAIGGTVLIGTLSGLVTIIGEIVNLTPKLFNALKENFDVKKIFPATKYLLELGKVVMEFNYFTDTIRDVKRNMPNLDFNINSENLTNALSTSDKLKKSQKESIDAIAESYSNLKTKLTGIFSETTETINNIVNKKYEFETPETSAFTNAVNEMVGKADSKIKGLATHLYGNIVDALTDSTKYKKQYPMGSVYGFKAVQLAGVQTPYYEPPDFSDIRSSWQNLSESMTQSFADVFISEAPSIWQGFFGKANSFFELFAMRLGEEILTRTSTGLLTSVLGNVSNDSFLGSVASFLGFAKKSTAESNTNILVQISNDQIYRANQKVVPSVYSDMERRNLL